MMSAKVSKPLTSALAAEEDKLLACVHCGLCLEACPTYIHTGDENDSPRGRIYLMRAVEEDRLNSSAPAFARHINRCLGCRACEQACPAGVEYGQLLEAARAEIKTVEAKRKLSSKLLHIALNQLWLHPARLRFAFILARVVRDAGIIKLLLKTRIARLVSPQMEFALALLESSSPVALNETMSSDNFPFETNDAQSNSKNAVKPTILKEQDALLFKGCVMEGLFARVNRATMRVLKSNGCAVHVPQAQVCCGALHAHAGDLEGARTLARHNIEAFSIGNVEDSRPIITNAGGCGAMLASYAHLLIDDRDYAKRAQRFSARVRDVSQQLEITGLRRGAALPKSVTTYDASCHLLYGQHAMNEPLKMLRAIPELEFAPLAESAVCCGGAGIYNLLQPDLSTRVLDEKLAHIKATKAEILATGNPGCHMQIGAGAQLNNMQSLRVCHPVELLDESYRRAGFYETSRKV